MTPLSSALATVVYVVAPVVCAVVAHTVFINKDLLPSLKVPISQRLFGANKTLRGFLIVPVLTAAAVYLTVPLDALWHDRLVVSFADGPRWAIGLGLGFSYMLFELPNSYLKRWLGIAPGKKADRYKLFFVLLDQTDSPLGVLLFCLLVFHLPADVLLVGLLLGVAGHWCVNMALYAVGLRKELM